MYDTLVSALDLRVGRLTCFKLGKLFLAPKLSEKTTSNHYYKLYIFLQLVVFIGKLTYLWFGGQVHVVYKTVYCRQLVFCWSRLDPRQFSFPEQHTVNSPPDSNCYIARLLQLFAESSKACNKYSILFYFILLHS